jgi:hypothetical protein
MDKPEHGERRSETRFPISIPVDYNSPDFSFKKALTKNISSKGISLQTDFDIPKGVLLNFLLDFDANIDKLTCQGKSVWSKFLGQGKYLIGIRLESPSIKPIPLVLQNINSKLK